MLGYFHCLTYESHRLYPYRHRCHVFSFMWMIRCKWELQEWRSELLQSSYWHLSLKGNFKAAAGLSRFEADLKSSDLWAFFQHCSCVTSQRAGVCVPGSSLNISLCHSSWSYWEKGGRNKWSLPQRPTSLYRLSSTFTKYISFSLSLSPLS